VCLHPDIYQVIKKRGGQSAKEGTMKVLGFNHLSVGAQNLEESARFYQSVLGMELIPTYNFGFKTKYLRCGDLQLHLFELEDHVPVYQHFAIDVDDFHAAYDRAKAAGALDFKAFRNAVNELPDGCVQMYLRDPAGNLIEIDWPDVRTLDRSRIPELKLLTEFASQDAEGLKASLYLDRPHMKADISKSGR
jgi:catechol 2,3-dioxygenase-like lactoylglutathione lyase family enzyme